MDELRESEAANPTPENAAALESARSTLTKVAALKHGEVNVSRKMKKVQFSEDFV